MTACVNEEKKMKGGALSGKVGRTFLAGALAATMVPSIAYADAGVTGDQPSEAESLNAIWPGEFAAELNKDVLIYNGEIQTVELSISYKHTLADKNPGAWKVFAGETLATATEVAATESRDWKVVDSGFLGPKEWKAELEFQVKESGNYNIWLVQGENTEHLTSLTVKKAQVTDASWNTSSSVAGEYDGSTKTVAWTGGTIPVSASDVVVTGKDGYKFEPGVDYDVEVAGDPVDEGSYTVTVVGKDTEAAGNYDFSSIALTLKIERAHNMTKNEAFAKGTAVEAKDNNNYAIEDLGSVEWTYDEKEHSVVVEKVLPKGETEAIDVTDPSKFVQSIVSVDEDGTLGTAVSNPTNAGRYAVVIMPQAKSGYEAQGGDATKPFVFYYTIEQADISGAVAFDDTNTVRDLSDDEFTWNAGNQKIGLAFGDKVLTDAQSIVNYKVLASDKTTEVASSSANTCALVPGTYYVAYKATNPNYKGSGEIEITVDKLDLADAGLFVNDQTDPVKNALDYVELGADSPVQDIVDFKAEVQASLDKAMVNYGEYELTVTPKAKVDDDNNEGDRESYVTGSWSASFDYVGEVVDEFYYGDETLASFDGEVFSAAHEGRGFDPANIKVYKDKSKNDVVDADDYTVTVTKDGKAVTSYDAPGTYVVTVEVQTSDYSLGGKAQAEFSVVADSLGNADVVVTDAVSGKVVPTVISQVTDWTANAYTYDGTDLSSNLKVAIDIDGEELKQGVDYKLVLTTGGSYYEEGTMDRNPDAKVVDKAVNAGTYYLNVVGVNYADWTAVEFVVSPIDVDQVRFSQEAYDWTSGAFHTGSAEGIPYTGSAVAPKVQYSDDNGATWKDLPTELYRLDNFQTLDAKGNWVDIDASEAVDAGSYKADVLFLDCELAKNYDFAGVSSEGIEFDVVDRVAFDDVQASQWYAHSVVDAYNAGYINGYSGTKLFGPDNAIKRGDVACILFNVASVSKVADQDFWINQGSSYSAFSDVEPGVYWTGAINWAANAEVVNGFAGTGQFGADQAVTREALASMLANYAKAMKVYKAPASTDLSSFDDADGVSGWALDNVAWAVENGIMGNGGYIDAQGEITRAEVAAMVMNFVEEFNLA